MRVLLFLCFCLAPIAAQHLTIGVKGGIPLSDFYRDSMEGGHFFAGSDTSKPVRYTVGPTVEVALPFHLSVETSALYQRFHYSSTGTPLNLFVSLRDFTAKTTGNAWSFEPLLKFRPDGSHLPWVAAGPVVRHLGGLHQWVNETIQTLPSGAFSFQRREVSDPRDFSKRWYPGVAFAGGFDIKMRRARVSPELRYTRWTANTASDGVRLRFPGNQFDLLLGVGF
jgi:hypothetical protein